MRDQLRARLAEVWPELEIVGEAKNGLEAVELVEPQHPDVVFLDIRMPGLSGVDAARASRSCRRATTTTAPRPTPGRGTAARSSSSPPTTSTRSRRSSRAWPTTCSSRPSASACSVTVVAHQAAPGAARHRRRAAGAAALQQLLHKLAAKLNPGARAGAAMDPGHGRPGIQMIPVEDVLFFISDEKYTRVQTATHRGADPQADQGAGRRGRPRPVLADPPLDAGQHAAASRASRATCAGARSSRQGQQREAGSQPQLHAPVQGHVAARLRPPAGAGVDDARARLPRRRAPPPHRAQLPAARADPRPSAPRAASSRR